MGTSKYIKPTESELEILRILWERNKASVREVHEELSKTKEAGYTTTLKLMQIMFEKGLVGRDDSVKIHVYHPVVSREKNYTRTLRNCHRLMASTHVRVTSFDWINVDCHALGPDDFVYFDPPYLGADVRPYGSSSVVHRDLVRTLKRANFKWMLSEYPNELYLRELGQPIFAENVQLKAANYHQNGGKERRIECIWRNY